MPGLAEPRSAASRASSSYQRASSAFRHPRGAAVCGFTRSSRAARLRQGGIAQQLGEQARAALWASWMPRLYQPEALQLRSDQLPVVGDQQHAPGKAAMAGRNARQIQIRDCGLSSQSMWWLPRDRARNSNRARSPPLGCTCWPWRAGKTPGSAPVARHLRQRGQGYSASLRVASSASCCRDPDRNRRCSRPVAGASPPADSGLSVRASTGAAGEDLPVPLAQQGDPVPARPPESLGTQQRWRVPVPAIRRGPQSQQGVGGQAHSRAARAARGQRRHLALLLLQAGDAFSMDLAWRTSFSLSCSAPRWRGACCLALRRSSFARPPGGAGRQPSRRALAHTGCWAGESAATGRLAGSGSEP